MPGPQSYLRRMSDEGGQLGVNSLSMGHLVQAAVATAQSNPTKFPTRRSGYIVSPLAPWKMSWDKLVLASMVYTAIITPFQIGFVDTDVQAVDALFILDRMVDVVLVTDFCLCFITG